MASKWIKYLGINLTKEVKEMYNENYNILTKEIKKMIEKWKDTPCSLAERFNTFKISKQPKQSTHSMNHLWKLNDIFHRNRKMHPKIHKESQEIPSNQNDFGKKNKVENHTFKTARKL